MVGVQPPQLGGLIVAASGQNVRCWMKGDRTKTVAVALQSCATRRRRIVGGQPPQLGSLIVAASCKNWCGGMKNDEKMSLL